MKNKNTQSLAKKYPFYHRDTNLFSVYTSTNTYSAVGSNFGRRRYMYVIHNIICCGLAYHIDEYFDLH